MRFTPLTPTRLVRELADWVLTIAARTPGSSSARPGGTVIGFDGPSEVGTAKLADAVGETLRSSGLPVVRAGTGWWWRPQALRLELGREDVDMLLTGWVDTDALTRELVGPVRDCRPSLTRLRDPGSDRSVRQAYAPWLPGTLLLLDGPFLSVTELRFDGLVGLDVSTGALRRALPPARQWWLEGFQRYRDEYQPSANADVVLSYDHPASPAAAGLAGHAPAPR